MKKSKFASSLCAILMAATFFFLPFTEIHAAESTSASAMEEQSAATAISPVTTETEMTAVITETSATVEIPPETAKPIPPAETLPLTPAPMGAAEGDTAGGDAADGNTPTPETAKDYRYNVTISFGYFSFVYDWGVWDSNSFSYQASPSSAYPSAHTTPGNPGWYNFDGINNKISIQCQDTLEFPFNVEYPFSVTFESKLASDDVSPLYPGIYLELYSPVYNGEPTEWNMQVSKDADPNQNPIPLKKVDANNFKVYSHYQGFNVFKQDFYVSFGGLPLDNTDKQFSSTQMQEIGNITLKIGKPLTLQTPIEPAT